MRLMGSRSVTLLCLPLKNVRLVSQCLLMLINVIHKGSLPDSSLTTYPMGAPLSDILLSFVLEKIYCLRCMRTEVPLILV